MFDTLPTVGQRFCSRDGSKLMKICGGSAFPSNRQQKDPRSIPSPPLGESWLSFCRAKQNQVFLGSLFFFFRPSPPTVLCVFHVDLVDFRGKSDVPTGPPTSHQDPTPRYLKSQEERPAAVQPLSSFSCMVVVGKHWTHFAYGGLVVEIQPLNC